MPPKQGPHAHCTIKRTFQRKHFATFADARADRPSRITTVTDRCNIPLFGIEREAGVCRSCAKGHETDDNKFANEAEKQRAFEAHKAFYIKVLSSTIPRAIVCNLDEYLGPEPFRRKTAPQPRRRR